MTDTQWSEIKSAYTAEFRPKIAARRNLLAAVVNLRSVSHGRPATIASAYTLTAEDHNRILFLGAGASISIPAGLPLYFRCSIRNITAGAPVVAPETNVDLNIGANGIAVNLDTSGQMMPGGIAELAQISPNLFWLHGNVTSV